MIVLASTLKPSAGDALSGRYRGIFDAPMVQLTEGDVVVRDARLESTYGVGTNNHGIDGTNITDARISNVTVWEPGGDGFRWKGTDRGGIGPQLVSCRSFVHIYGAGFRIETEYTQLTQCQAYGGTTGFYLDAGNVQMVGCQASNNTDGLVIRSANGNDGHAVISGCQFNHNTQYAIDIGETANGVTVSGCHAYYGKIRVAPGALARFVGCTIDVVELELAGATVQFEACVWPHANANTFTTDSNTNLIWNDSNRRLDGSVFTP